MKTFLSRFHKQQLEQIRRNLTAIGAKEGNFVKVELLFYEALAVAKEYGSDESENAFLAAFKRVQYNEYRRTKDFFKKNTQRERVIARFISSVKAVLSAGIQDRFSPLSPST